MTDSRRDDEFEASEGDIQEQRRSQNDLGLDPEHTAETSTPDGSSVEANPADVQEQSMDVPEDDDYPSEDPTNW